MEQLDPYIQMNHFLRFLDNGLRVNTEQLTSALSTKNIWPATSDDHLPVYLARLCERWLPIIRSAMAERNADILIRRYSLDGWRHALLRELSVDMGCPRGSDSIFGAC